MAKSDKNDYFKCKYQGNRHFKHSLWPNLTKIVTLNAYESCKSEWKVNGKLY